MADAQAQMVWEDPPRRHQRSEWFEPLMALQAKPGEYARLSTLDTAANASTLASTVRNAAAHLAGTGASGSWEIISRSIPAGGAGVWARWNPVPAKVVAGKSIPEDELAEAERAEHLPEDGDEFPWGPI